MMKNGDAEILDSFGLVFFIFRDPFFFSPTYEVKVLRIF